VLLDCVIYCAFYSILFRGPFFSGHGVYNQNELKDTIRTKDSYDDTSQMDWYKFVLVITASNLILSIVCMVPETAMNSQTLTHAPSIQSLNNDSCNPMSFSLLPV